MKARFLTVVLILSGLFVTTTTCYACNLSPEAILQALRKYVIVGRRAILDGSDSHDPDGEITKYEWDFTDNGSYDYSETSSSYPDGAFDGITTHIYDSNGTYTVALRVTDDGSPGLTDIDDCNIYVGPDSDNDGLPADWEELYDFNDANFADADQDSDGDSYINLCEYLHGSEPNDINDVPDPNFPITIYVPDDVNSIQRAINASIAGDTIVVSEGTYYEVIDFNGVSCSLTSTDPNDWDVIANTIIDADNSDANVVTFENSEDANSVLRGFTITGGARGIYCNGTSPTIGNCVITDNNCSTSGSGMYNYNSSPTVTNCTFSNNSAEKHGGGIHNFYYSSPSITNCIFNGNAATRWYGGGMFNYDYSSPTVINCVFSKNQAIGGGDYGGYGGGMANHTQSSPTLINCTFSGNVAHIYGSNSGYGGGMFDHENSDPNVTNCIFWGNDANGSGDEIYNWDANSDPNFSFCDIEGCGGSGDWDPNFGTDGGGNIDSDPNFIDAGDPAGPDGAFGTYDDGLQLQIISPCIDAASGNSAPSTDIAGRGRVDVDSVDNTGTGDPNYADIGAYESLVIWFVDKDATGSDDGSSWEDAFTDLQGALGDANDGDEIWVAEGTYKPTSGSNRLVSFELVEGVDVYGRFAGTEISRHQRDMMLHETILSGDIGTPGNQSDNSCHVVKGANRVTLDGFTITGGNANSRTPPDNMGGGMYNPSSSPTVTNCIFSGNSATYGGGMYNSSGNTDIINCIFSGSSATYGGGMYNSSGNTDIINCTFSGNEAVIYGGGMYNYHSSSSPTVTNCIFWGNDAVTDGNEIYNNPSNPTLSYCDIKGCGGSEGWDPNFGSNGGGNIDSDPCFLDVNNPAGLDGLFGTFDDGLRLLAQSPCIDAGDGDVAPLEDILGLGRVDINDANSGAGEPNYTDIGCYESYSGYGSDTDGDGLWDYEEYLLGTDPDDCDSDDDGLSDGNEFNVHHTNPLLIDTDGDGLSDSDELNVYNTNPTSSDTDSDGMPDGWEVDNGLDPLDDSDANEDPDNDGLSNLGEFNNNADPHDKDTDNDYMPDGWEVDNNLEPDDDTGDNGANGNPDGDNYTNLSEYLHGSDPQDDQSEPESTTTITVPTEAGSIQWAIDLSINGDVVEVMKGLYYESIDFNGMAITVTSTDPNDWWVVEATIIDANEASQAVLFNNGEGSNSVLKGLTLTNGTYGISCSTSPTITNCIIEENSSHGIYCTSGSPEIKNSMIGENDGAGIYSSSSSSLVIKNSWIYKNDNKGMEFSSCSSETTIRNNTIAYNTNYGIYVDPEADDPTIINCIIWDNGDDLYSCSATYSCIKNQDDNGEGVIHSDPKFIDPDSYDYRLQRTSPCINAGTGTYSDETDIEGQVRMAKSIDMGADEVCEVHNFTQDIWYSDKDGEGIQDAIDDANDGDVIKVYEWTFYESIVFDGNSITVRSTDPNDWAVVECTIINANNPDANVVTFDPSGDANSVLKGFTLTGGKNGAYCSNSSSPTISNCIITANNSVGVACISGSPIITCCKIGENSEDGIYSSSTTPPTIKSNLIYKNNGKGISFASAGSATTIRNNTIVDNEEYGISVSGTEPNVSNCILWGHDSNDLIGCSATYSCIEDTNDANGIGNFTSDPMFINTNSNNYVVDSLSPCVNAGDPNGYYTGEVDLYGKERVLLGDPDTGASEIARIYVKKGSTYTDSEEDSWANAYGELRDAAPAGATEIWVAQGIYTPAEHSSNDRLAAFQIGVDVTIKGGYAGFGTDPDFRDIALYETILSGDIDENDDSGGDNSENSYHVVIGEDGATYDGITIENGNANGASYPDNVGGGMYNKMCTNTVINCTFRNNHATLEGGGMYNETGRETPSLTNCTFENNTAGGNGGAISNFYAVPNIDNCVFVDNSADKGGGIYNYWNITGYITITNCVFYDNGDSATTSGGALCNWLIMTYNTPKVTNCTFHKNTASYGNSVRNILSYKPIITNCIMWNDPDQGDEVDNCIYSHPIITYCDIKGGYSGTGNIDADPQFVDPDDPLGPDHIFGTADDGLALIYWGPTQDDDSPCIDKCPNVSFTTDIIGNKREMGTDVDMGAYEAMKTKGHWKLDGNANDSSGNGKTGTVEGDPETKTDGGIFDDALQLDGVGDHIWINPGSGDFYSTENDFTWSGWVSLLDGQTITQGGAIIAKCPSTGYGSGDNCLYVVDSTDDYDGTLAFNTGGAGGNTLLSNNKINDGLWHHVAVTVKFGPVPADNDVIKLYIDGDLDNTEDTWNLNDGAESERLKIGYANGFSHDFEGRIDDVRVYDYVLEDDYEQVKKLIEEASYWRFVVLCDSRDDSSRDPDDPIYDGVNNYRLQEMADAIVAEKAEFVVFPGDLVKGSGPLAPYNNVKAQLKLWRDVMTPVYDAGITVMPVRGNHEIAGSDPSEDWKAVFPEIPDNGPDESYNGFTYYIKHRNALFVGMDVYDGVDDNKPHELNQTNLDWLYGVLGDNTWAIAGDDVRQHVFSFTHEPAFSVDHDDCLDDHAYERDEFWETLEYEPGCRIYFCGHDHFYDHLDADNDDAAIPNVHQMLVGTAGAPLRNDSDYDGDNSAWTLTREKHVGGVGSDLYGYVVAEVYGANVRTHWKQRKDTVLNLPYPGAYEPGGDVFEYGLPDDTTAPEIASATASVKDKVYVVFSEWVEKSSAETANNYTIDNGVQVDSATLQADMKTVMLQLENNDWLLDKDTVYTLTVNNVKDRSSGQNAANNETKQLVFTYDNQVSFGKDDAEEKSGLMNWTSSDLELIYDGGIQKVGIRFDHVEIERYALIDKAYIQFTAKTAHSGNCPLTVHGEDTGNANGFDEQNISLRDLTTNYVSWSPAPWTEGHAGAAQRVDITDIIHEIVNRGDWSRSNALVIIITGTSSNIRRAWSYNGEYDAAPLLHLEFKFPNDP